MSSIMLGRHLMKMNTVMHLIKENLTEQLEIPIELPDALDYTRAHGLVLWCEHLPHHGVWYRTNPGPISNSSYLKGHN